MTGSVPFFQVDAFADRPFAGNPAAVMVLDGWPGDDVLQAIAAENNISETAFLVEEAPGSDAHYALRWFTPTIEIALCGHATLASGHVLIGERSSIRFRTRQAGTLTVARAGDIGLTLDLPSWPASPRPLPEIAAMLGGPVEDSLWREGCYAVLVYPDAAAVRALTPDFRALAALGNILFIATAPGDDTDVVSRVFAPGAGIDEDPVTGSAHCVLADYWCRRLDRLGFSAEQASARGGRLHVALNGDRVILTGRCRTVIKGRFLL